MATRDLVRLEREVRRLRAAMMGLSVLVLGLLITGFGGSQVGVLEGTALRLVDDDGEMWAAIVPNRRAGGRIEILTDDNRIIVSVGGDDETGVFVEIDDVSYRWPSTGDEE